MKLRDLLITVLVLAGLTGVTIGVGLWSVPAGFVVGGLALLGVAVLLEVAALKRDAARVLAGQPPT